MFTSKKADDFSVRLKQPNFFWSENKWMFGGEGEKSLLRKTKFNSLLIKYVHENNLLSMFQTNLERMWKTH